MARILHVEDDPLWRDLIRNRFTDHHVDSADSLNKALEYLLSRAPYDLALVDLRLDNYTDLSGGEVLDLLREHYPTTRRIVITGSPPAGPVRATVFERYEVEEIIIKGEFGAPDLRRVVEEALARAPSALSVEFRLKRSELRQRYRDWKRRVGIEIRDETRLAEQRQWQAAEVSEQDRSKAEIVVEAVKVKRIAFEEEAYNIARLLESIENIENLVTASDALGAAEDRFSPVFDE